MSTADEITYLPVSNTGGSPNQINRNTADILDKVDPQQLAELVRMRLLGNEFKNGIWVKVGGLSANTNLSDTGAWEISNYILSCANLSTSTSKMNDREIKKRAGSITNSVIRDCLKNLGRYGINNPSKLIQIKEIVFGICYIVLKHSDDAYFYDGLTKIKSEQHTSINQPKVNTMDKIKAGLGLR